MAVKKQEEVHNDAFDWARWVWFTGIHTSRHPASTG